MELLLVCDDCSQEARLQQNSHLSHSKPAPNQMMSSVNKKFRNTLAALTALEITTLQVVLRGISIGN